MIKKISTFLILLFLINHCEYKPIYSNIKKVNFKLNIIEITGDDEMNNLVLSNLKKYSNTSSEKIYNLKINTDYKKKDLIKNKKGEITSFLLINEINFEVINNKINKNFEFSEQIKTNNDNDKFEFKNYEKTIKSNFINSKINNLILKLSSLE